MKMRIMNRGRIKKNPDRIMKIVKGRALLEKKGRLKDATFWSDEQVIEWLKKNPQKQLKVSEHLPKLQNAKIVV